MFLLAASMGILMTDHGIPSNQPETNPRCPGFGNCSCQTRLTQKPQIPLRPPWSLRATKAGSNIGFLVPCSLHSTQQHPTSTLHRGGGAPQRFQEDFPAGHSPSSLLDPGLDILVIYLEHFRTLYLVGGIPTPLKNMKVTWADYSQYMEPYGKIKAMFQTTNQVLSNAAPDIGEKKHSRSMILIDPGLAKMRIFLTVKVLVDKKRQFSVCRGVEYNKLA